MGPQMRHPDFTLHRPPLWLAAAAVASGWAAVFSIVFWVVQFLSRPVHEDTRMTYVAAEAGLRYGWSTIYDRSTLASMSSSFPPESRAIDAALTYLNPPLVAWVFAPFTAFPEPIAYVLWTLVSLGALVLAWHIAAPYTGLAKVTLLLLAIGLWPVMLAFYFGQPILIELALVAAAWWLCTKDQPLAAGAALALATFMKPQLVALVPVALLVSGRYRAVTGWAGGCLLLGIASAAALGPSGLSSWWHAVNEGQATPAHVEYTLVHFFGMGPLTYLLWALQGTAALFIAWRRKRDVEIVFAAGLLGTTVTAFHFHEADYSSLVLAAWFVLRTSPPLWHRLWLLAGVVPMQVMTYGPRANQPIWDIATHAPQLLWDAGWLAILIAGGFAAKRATDPGTRRLAESGYG
jgi:hypothetical protein